MPPADVDALAQLRWLKPVADATANAFLEEQPFGPQAQVPSTGTLVFCTFTPNADLVANATNYATLNLYKHTAGGARVLVASASTTPTGTGNWINGVPFSLTISQPNVTAEDTLGLEIVKVGTGVVVPAGMLAVLPTPSFIETTLADWSSEFNARLKKRYAVPFNPANPPAIIQRWLTKVVTRDCFAKRGYNPTSLQDKEAILDEAVAALAELKEAAESENGLFDLPLLNDDAASAVTQGGPYAYSEQSPYTWLTLQRNAGRNEDKQSGH